MSDTSKPNDMAKFEAQIEAMLEKASKKADEIIEAAETKAAEIAGTKTVKRDIVPIRKQERVMIKLPKDKEKNNTDLPVSINGEKPWLVQRGVWVKVPLSVAEVIENSLRQEEYAIQYSEGLSEQFTEKLKTL